MAGRATDVEYMRRMVHGQARNRGGRAITRTDPADAKAPLIQFVPDAG